MSFSDLVASMDASLLSTFGEVQATLHFKDATPDLTLTAVVKNPAFEEDYVPGSAQGVGVLLLFIHMTPAQVAAARYPINGDTATVAGVDYDIWQVDTDREDGRTLRCRRRTQRFDQ